MNKNDDIALSVRNLKTFFYTNNRCNKAVNGVSFDVKKGKTLLVKENRFKSTNRNSIQTLTVRKVITIVLELI